jgi:hypothetical protein
MEHRLRRDIPTFHSMLIIIAEALTDGLAAD